MLRAEGQRPPTEALETTRLASSRPRAEVGTVKAKGTVRFRGEADPARLDIPYQNPPLGASA